METNHYVYMYYQKQLSVFMSKASNVLIKMLKTRNMSKTLNMLSKVINNIWSNKKIYISLINVKHAKKTSNLSKTSHLSKNFKYVKNIKYLQKHQICQNHQMCQNVR